jgi:hypothetical protein
MTEGASPTGDRRDRDGLPSLRASHADRDRTVEVLRDAAGDGRLTPSELDERVEAALTARTGSELAALTADLTLVIRPGIVVDVDDLIVRMGDVNVRPAAGGVPVTLMVVVSGRVRGGNVVARLPRRTFREWMRRQPPRWQSPAG